MKAVVFHEFGGLDVLRSRSVPDPSPGPGEVLIDIGACALNHLDVDVREGISRFPVEPPFVLGRRGRRPDRRGRRRASRAGRSATA